MTKTAYWWDYCNMKKPTYVSNFDVNSYTTLASKLTGYKVMLKEDPYAIAPMWTDIRCSGVIMYNPKYTQLHSSVYHEVGHLICNPKAFMSGINFDAFIKAEEYAEIESLKLCDKYNDTDAAVDLINIVFVDRVACKYYDRKEHYYARKNLLKNKKYIDLCCKYADVPMLLNKANEWESVVDKNGSFKIVNMD